jgi:hypothetical protein
MGSAVVKPVSVSEMGTEWFFEREEAYLRKLSQKPDRECACFTLQVQS